MRYRYVTADVFTDVPFAGNPLAVLPDARGLDGPLLVQIAREFNYSETVFVYPPADPAHTRRLRIFTPGRELPFAGHPTVGTACVLAAIGELALPGARVEIVFEEGAGPVPVEIEIGGRGPHLARLTAPRLPEMGPPPPSPAVLAEMLGLESEDVLATADERPESHSCGVPFLFVPLRSREAVARAGVTRDAWARNLRDYWAPEVFVFTRDTRAAGVDLHARMFAPAMGVAEDPATGAAVAALSGYLTRRVPGDGRHRWTIAQGVEMGRPSRLELEVEVQAGKATRVRVGGRAVLMAEGTIEVPSA